MSQKSNIKEEVNSTVRSMISAIPLFGGFLNEAFFDYRWRIKQNRLNEFTELLEQSITIDQNINIDNIKPEDFGDLLESVIRRVVQTKSREKHKRFKDVLLNALVSPSNDLDSSEIYLDLIATLNDDEVHVLYGHRHFDNTYSNGKLSLRNSNKELNRLNEELKKEEAILADGRANNYDLVMVHLDSLKEFIAETNLKHKSFEKFRNAEYYGLTPSRFLYCKQSLSSKALLVDDAVGSMEARAFQLMSITEFGLEFINFILKNEQVE